MGRDFFSGEFSGKYDLTKVENGITNTSGTVTIKIEKVGVGAYLQTIVYDRRTTINVLGFEKDGVLVSQNQSGQGINYTYFDGKHLFHKDSNKSPTTWTTRVCKLRRDRDRDRC